jgi:hypothetical protein
MTAKEYIIKKIGRNNNKNNNNNNKNNNNFNNSLGIQMLNRNYTNTLPKLDVGYNRVIYNTKPILNTAVNDVASERYKKFIETCVSIDSKDRLSGNPNNYKIYLGKEFINVIEIELVNIQFPNCFSVINPTNNVLSWRYITSDELENYFEDCIDTETLATTYEFPMIELDAEKVSVKNGINYTIFDLENEIMNAMNSVVHKSGEPYSVAGTLTSFYVNIDVVSEKVLFINRKEELLVDNVEVDASGDIFIDFLSSSSNPFSIKPELPVIITNICNTTNNIGGVPTSLFNEREFTYDEDIKWISYGAGINRYQLILKDEDDNLIKGKYPEIVSGTTCTSDTGRRALIGQGLPFVFEGDITSLLNILGWSFPTYETACCKNSDTNLNCTKKDCNCLCIYDENGDITNQKYTDIIPGEKDCLMIKNSKTWASIHESPISLSSDIGCLKIVKIDNSSTNIKKNYLMIPDSPYIFMKLKFPSLPDDTLGNNVIKAETINGGYVSTYDNCNVENYNGDDRRKDTGNLFAKIIFDTRLSSVYNENFICNKKVLYEKVLTKLDMLEIEFVDRNGYPIYNCKNSNFTIKITEKMDVLKETLINTRTGSISNTGFGM